LYNFIFFPICTRTHYLDLILPSYLIQHFNDTFRQSVIDLIHGQIKDLNEFVDDNKIEQLKNIVQATLVPTKRAPLEYFHYGVLGNDLKMIEDTIYFTRFLYYPFFKRLAV
jgi:hypothetical protein